MSAAVEDLTDQAEMTTLDPAAAWQQHASPTDLLTAGIKQDSLGMCEAVCLQHPEALHGRDSTDQATPAHWCALLGNVELLVERWRHSSAARPPRTDPPGSWLLYVMITRARAAQISTRGCGATVGACQSLSARTFNTQVGILEWLAKQGSPMTDVVVSSGMQPIHWACTRGHTEVVKLLLRLGVSAGGTHRPGLSCQHPGTPMAPRAEAASLRGLRPGAEARG